MAEQWTQKGTQRILIGASDNKKPGLKAGFRNC